MAILDGQFAGEMRRVLRPTTVAFELGLLRDVDQEECDALWKAAQRYGSYLALEPSLSFGPSQRSATLRGRDDGLGTSAFC